MEKVRGYVAIVLDKDSATRVAALAVHETVFAHHATVAFMPTEAEFARLYKHREGELFALTVTSMVQDALGQALVLEPFLAALESSKRAHVTVSCVEGTGPVYSNQLMETAEAVPMSMTLSGTLTLVRFPSSD